MTLTFGKLRGTQTWGGRLAELERAEAAQSAVELESEAGQAALLLRRLLFADAWCLFAYSVVFCSLFPPSIVLSRTFGGRSIGTTGPLVDPWELKNRRRVALIDKKFQRGLSPAEDAELDELQAEHGAYLDAIQPPPFVKLEELEAIARQLNTRPMLPPGNTRPDGIHHSYFRRRQRGELPGIY
jgi:hypothetical protein